eukprot:TRINITY_DN32671_c0_g1_i1.p1 TRINITY_DN32671_c0_g1~~TRINITY_DN32671_c0_g1_i1.p1  ORF type:complete len:463 (+),score=174.80 TRINITY_DN32671_c0_g1_i1:43-1389(+)
MPGQLSVNTSCAHGTQDVLKAVVARERLLRLVQTPCAVRLTGDVVWVVTRDEIEQQLLPPQRRRTWLARIRDMAELCRKVPSAELLEPLRVNAPDLFGFVPQTWVLPRDAGRVPRRGTLILKPDDGSQGDGIFLLQGRQDLERRMRTCGVTGEGCIVQRYLPRPALLDGHKFDFRVYVVCFCDLAGRWEAMLCSEGLARVCADPYEQPTARNMHRCTAHLTNYSLNKLSTAYSMADDGVTGSKRLLSAVLRRLQLEHPDWDVARQLSLIAARTVAALHSAWAVRFRAPDMHAFHILGLDVLLDDGGGAHLLEINNSPSMVITTPWPLDAASLPAAAQGQKTCKCMSHHKPHVHVQSRVDVAAKAAVVGDTLKLVRRMRKAGVSLPSQLDEGNLFGSLALLDIDAAGAEVDVARRAVPPAAAEQPCRAGPAAARRAGLQPTPPRAPVRC